MTRTTTQHILNVGEGLERLMGDDVLYLQLLRRFRRDYGGAAAQIRALLAQGDRHGAQRMAHTLKGAAGMIGAQELHHLAGVSEAGCGTSGLAAHAGLELLDGALATLLTLINARLDDSIEPSGAATQAVPLTGPEARRLIAHLAHLLDDGNGEAIDVLERSATMLAASLGVAVFQEVAAAAHEFDFEAALEALQPALGGEHASA
jgi:HPt (histidine-containing phosphotransfer) domain-containing protein